MFGQINGEFAAPVALSRMTKNPRFLEHGRSCSPEGDTHTHSTGSLVVWFGVELGVCVYVCGGVSPRENVCR